jgi:hypothetical protein
VAVAAREFRGRPRGGHQPELPGWTATLDKMKPPAAVGLGGLPAGVNPKNLLLAAGGAVSEPAG